MNCFSCTKPKIKEREIEEGQQTNSSTGELQGREVSTSSSNDQKKTKSISMLKAHVTIINYTSNINSNKIQCSTLSHQISARSFVQFLCSNRKPLIQIALIGTVWCEKKTKQNKTKSI